MPLCRHCRRLRATRPMGLCWTCYYTPGVRSLYPSTSKYARRGVRDFVISVVGSPRLPPEPTTALPGSEEKIEVLAERARLGVSLWHPDDFTYENEYSMFSI